MFTPWQQIKQHRIRFLKTVVICIVDLAHGLHKGNLGPALFDLGHQVSQQISTTSFIITSSRVGHLFGAASCALWYPRMDFLYFSAITYFVLAGLEIMIPFMSYVGVLITMFLFNGVIEGAYNAGEHAFLSQLWGTESLFFRQTSEIFDGIGHSLAPLVLTPFLLRKRDLGNDTTVFYPEKVNLVPPFAVFSGCLLFSAILALLIWKFTGPTTDHPSRIAKRKVSQLDELDMDQTVVYTPPPEKRSKYTIFLVVLFTLFHIFEAMLTSNLTKFIAFFAASSDLSARKGAELTTVFFFSMTATRIAGLFYVQLIGVEINFIVNICLLLISNVLLFIFEYGFGERIFIWLGIGLIGVSMANNKSCMAGYLDKQVLVTGKMAAVIHTLEKIPNMILPYVLSTLMEKDPKAFLWFIAICSLVKTSLIVSFMVLSRIKERNEKQCTNL